MGESLETIKRLIDDCSEADRRAVRLHLGTLLPHPLEREWGIDADTILNAINRSSDLTRRGIRGIIAEAVFVNEVAPGVSEIGWELVTFGGDHPYDALLKNAEQEARIQVKLQRLERGVPKLYYPKYYGESPQYVVEVQKTRTGERTTRRPAAGASELAGPNGPVTENTRPYSFDDFDILAVSMHPSSGDWKDFRYTVSKWLLPRRQEQSLIEIFQPVAVSPNDAWTDDLPTCLKWLEGGEQRMVLKERLHPKSPKNPTVRHTRRT